MRGSHPISDLGREADSCHERREQLHVRAGRIFRDRRSREGVARPTIRQSLRTGIGLLRAGEVELAEQTFLQVLRDDPLSGEARFFLGLIHQTRNHLDRQASITNTHSGSFPIWRKRDNLGIILQSQGRVNEAEASYREALRLEPDYPEAAQ